MHRASQPVARPKGDQHGQVKHLSFTHLLAASPASLQAMVETAGAAYRAMRSKELAESWDPAFRRARGDR